MGLPCYLAMTAAEFYAAARLPLNVAWMACHFSSYGTGLSNIPYTMPAGSMIIVNDRIPPSGHDPEAILMQLNQVISSLDIPYILLDMQRLNCKETAKIVSYLANHLSCKVGVTEHYAENTNGPVFLQSPLPHQTLFDRIRKWKNREIWLECATEEETAVITKDGCSFHLNPKKDMHIYPFSDDILSCHYQTQVKEDTVIVSLRRDTDDIIALIEQAEKENITLAVGLYQQLNKQKGC